MRDESDQSLHETGCEKSEKIIAEEVMVAK